MHFRLLGQVEVSADGEPLALGGRRQRAVLAVMLLHANEYVSADQLVEEAWSGRPPPGAAGTLQTYISRLRRLLADTGASLTTRGDGYELTIDPTELDVACFRRLSAEGRVALAAGNPQGACEMLEAALGLWRGQPLADLADERFAADAIRVLEEERLAAEVDRIDAGLEFGWSDVSFIGDIQRLVDRYPQDERLRERLMLALYRSGRQAEALAAYRDARAMLLDEFGIDPSERLRALERAILCQDPALAVAPTTEVAPGPIDAGTAESTRPGTRRLTARRVVGLSAAALAVLAAALAFGAIRLTDGATHAQWRSCCTEAGLLSSRDASLQAGLSLKSAPTAVAADHGVLWVTSSSSGLVDRVDVRHHILTRVVVAGSPAGVAVIRGLVWVADSSGRDLIRISAQAPKVVGRLDVCNGPLGLAVGLGALWVACPLDGTLAEINPATDTVERRIPVGASPTGVAVTGGDVWVTLESTGQVARYDPRSRIVTKITVGDGPSAIVAEKGEVWVADSLNRTVARIDASSGTVKSLTQVPSAPTALAAVPGGVWSAEPNGSRLRLLSGDPTAITRVVRTANPIVALTRDGSRIAAATTLSTARRRGGTVRFASTVHLATRPDPALSYDTIALQVEALTNDGLLGFRRDGGALGEILVPDLAEALPRAADSGRIWSLTLRPGVQYSTGRPVQAADIRYGLERAFEAGSPALPLYEDIVGASDCGAHRRCDLSRGILVHGRTITFRLNRPDSDFPNKLALPFADAVPTGWPLPRSNPTGTVGVVPATGPYQISRYVSGGKRIILTRNPRFKSWSSEAQPIGHPDKIVEEAVANDAALRQLITQHKVDLVEIDSASLLRWARARYPAEVVLSAVPATAWEVTNTRKPPFDDVRVRRALAYAVDRATAAQTSPIGEPACQILPPAFPGYSPYCPYSTPPGPSWARPDLRKARALISAAGVEGSRVRVVVVRGYSNDARALRPALHQLGFHATFEYVGIRKLLTLVARSPAHFDLTLEGWAADYPSPSDFFDEMFTCKSFVPASTSNRNLPEFCSPRIDRMIAKADRLQVVSPTRADRVWTAVDHAVAWQAPVIPLNSIGSAAWVSSKVTNYLYNPMLDVLLDQIWRNPTHG